MLGERSAYAAVKEFREQNLSKRMKEVHQVKDHKERHTAWRKANAEIGEMICDEVEILTREFRSHFGGSRSHSCLYCFLNEPCMACGVEQPVNKLINPDKKTEKFVSVTRDGRKYAGRWNAVWGCMSQMVRGNGLHLCHGCSVQTAMARVKEMDGRHANRIKQLKHAEEKLKKNNTQRNKNSLELHQQKFKDRPEPYLPILVKHGQMKGARLQFRVQDNGVPTFKLPPEEVGKGDRDHTFVWIKEDGTEEELPCVYYPGKDGTKKGNGCSKANRKRIADERMAKREKAHKKREEARRKEQERLQAEIKQRRIEKEKSDWIHQEAKKHIATWWNEAKEKFSDELSLDDQLNDVFQTEYQREGERYVSAQHSRFCQRLSITMSKYITLADYLAKVAKDAKDMREHGRIIDDDAICDKWQKREQGSGYRTVAERAEEKAADTAKSKVMDDVIARQKRKMAETRAKYMAEQAKRQKK